MNGKIVFIFVMFAVYILAALYTAIKLHRAYEKKDICGVVYYSVLFVSATALFTAGLR